MTDTFKRSVVKTIRLAGTTKRVAWDDIQKEGSYDLYLTSGKVVKNVYIIMINPRMLLGAFE